MAARLRDSPAAAMACRSGQGALLHGQHSCERIQSAGVLKLGRPEWLGERSFAHARVRVKERRGGSRGTQVRAGLEDLANNQVRTLEFVTPSSFQLQLAVLVTILLMGIL